MSAHRLAVVAVLTFAPSVVAADEPTVDPVRAFKLERVKLARQKVDMVRRMCFVSTEEVLSAVLVRNDAELDVADTPAARKLLYVERVRLLTAARAYYEALLAKGIGLGTELHTTQVQLARAQLAVAETAADRENGFAELARAAAALGEGERKARPVVGGDH